LTDNPGVPTTANIAMADSSQSCAGTDISSAGLLVYSSEICKSSESDMKTSSDMVGNDMVDSDIERSDYKNKKAIADAYTGN
jgi:hypothetical protein